MTSMRRRPVEVRAPDMGGSGAAVPSAGLAVAQLAADAAQTEGASPIGAVIAEGLRRYAENTATEVMKVVATLGVEQERLAQRGADLADMMRRSAQQYADEARALTASQQRVGELMTAEIAKLKGAA